MSTKTPRLNRFTQTVRFLRVSRLLLWTLWVIYRERRRVIRARERGNYEVRPNVEVLVKVLVAFRITAVKLGVLMVKLGQFLSSRADLLPEQALEALSSLQDEVPPAPFSHVVSVIETELGKPVEEVFSVLERKCTAAASLGQVHKAVLASTGAEVAVKIQRPNIDQLVRMDLSTLKFVIWVINRFVDTGEFIDLMGVYQEFKRTVYEEIDYVTEAANAKRFKEMFKDDPNIYIPSVYEDYTSRRLLVLEWIDGIKINDYATLEAEGISRLEVAKRTVSAYFYQFFAAGFFHADPHPGNVLLTDDGRLAIIDLGMVARVSRDTQDALIKLLLAVSDGRGGDAADVIVGLGDTLAEFDSATFRRRVEDLVSRNATLAVGDVQAGNLLGQVLEIAGEAGLRPPSELTMMGKAMLNLDEVARILDPNFEPNPTIEAHAAELMRRKMLQSASPGNMLAAAIDAREFAEKLPSRINKVMDALAEGQLTLNVQGIDEKELMRGVQKLANRLTTGMVVAALVIGAALIMRIDVRPKLFGYPALAIVLFALAAAAAAWLLISIAVSDLPQQRRRNRSP